MEIVNERVFVVGDDFEVSIANKYIIKNQPPKDGVKIFKGIIGIFDYLL
jgi:hypothetical protein